MLSMSYSPWPVLRRHHLDAAPAALEHGHVVDAHPVLAGEARILVGIHRAHVQPGIGAPHHLDHALGRAGGRVLLLEEIGEVDVLREARDHPLSLGRGRERLRARHVEVRVVPV
jgi:hypothetical protein